MNRLIVIGSLLMTFIAYACSDKDADKNEIDIAGKWKLMKVTASGLGTLFATHDCSSYNIIYEFKTNNILVVTGDPDISYGILSPGEYQYEYKTSDKVPALTVNGYSYSTISSMDEKSITFDGRAFDGPVEYFTRVR